MRTIVLILSTLAITGPALAQSSAVSPPATARTRTPTTGPNALPLNSGLGSNPTISTQGMGAGTISNDPGEAGNSGSIRAVPKSGG